MNLLCLLTPWKFFESHLGSKKNQCVSDIALYLGAFIGVPVYFKIFWIYVAPYSRFKTMFPWCRSQDLCFIVNFNLLEPRKQKERISLSCILFYLWRWKVSNMGHYTQNSTHYTKVMNILWQSQASFPVQSSRYNISWLTKGTSFGTVIFFCSSQDD